MCAPAVLFSNLSQILRIKGILCLDDDLGSSKMIRREISLQTVLPRIGDRKSFSFNWLKTISSRKTFKNKIIFLTHIAVDDQTENFAVVPVIYSGRTDPLSSCIKLTRARGNI